MKGWMDGMSDGRKLFEGLNISRNFLEVRKFITPFSSSRDNTDGIAILSNLCLSDLFRKMQIYSPPMS